MFTNEQKKRQRLAIFEQVDLYPVTCETLSNGRKDSEILEGIVAGGCRIVQLRDKEATKAQFFKKALYFRQITQQHNMLLIINDHVDVALAVDADGVHLGQEDFPVPEARRLLPDKIIGVSCHSLVEAVIAKQEGADYYNIGPIFSTQTKAGVKQVLGVEAIQVISREVDLPFTVMGGIHEGNIHQVLAAGARKIAVVTAVTMAPDVAQAVRQLRRIIQEYKPN